MCFCLLALLLAIQGNADVSDGSCEAGDASCSVSSATAKTNPKKKKKKKETETWFAGSHITSRYILNINTLNFNSTVTAHQNHSLLIAFFDPRSRSFTDLRPELEKTAEALAEQARSDEQPLGFIGAIDMTVDNYLAQMEAPEISSSWQDPDTKGTFKFGRPRFWPMVIIHYKNNSRVREYKGVVKKNYILDYLQRDLVPPDLESTSVDDLQGLLARTPGPFVAGCGLDAKPGANESELNSSKEVQEAFNLTSVALHGRMVFVRAQEAFCTASFGKSEDDGPRILYIRKSAVESKTPGGVIRANSNSKKKVLQDDWRMITWLVEQRSTVLEELTPDNSWMYLEKPAPLLIFMVTEDDYAMRANGEALFGNIEDKLAPEYYQLVWADCLEFGHQFELADKCPVVLMAEMTSQRGDVVTRNITWQELQNPPQPEREESWLLAATPEDRLLQWAENVTSPVRLIIEEHLNRTKNMTEAEGDDGVDDEDSNESTNGSVNESDESELPEMNDSKRPAINDTEADWAPDFLSEFEETENLTEAQQLENLPGNLNHLWHVLGHMLKLRWSFEATYGHTIPFNFSLLDRIQKNKYMGLLVSDFDDVAKVLSNKTERDMLWKSLEDRQEFLAKLDELVRKESNGEDVSQKKKRSMEKLQTNVLSSYEALRKLFRSLITQLERRARNGTLGISEPAVRDVERREASGLSVKEFIEKYARPGLPVIITGLNITDEEPWTREFFKRRCNVTVDLQRRNPKSKSWGRLEAAGRLPLADFIDTFTTDPERRKWYLHDWSLPRQCPDVFGPPPFTGYTVPKYFAGDYFQRSFSEGYQHSWPSLFVGSSETQSSMHIDSGNTNFILYLLSGKKEWRFYSYTDLINVYYSPAGAHFHFDVFKPNYEKHPLARYATQYRGIQEEGDLMFVPAGNPHAVRNLEDIHGVSMNYVDASNVEKSLLDRIWDRDLDLIELYSDHKSIPHGLRSDQQPLSFGEWKSTNWKKFDYDLRYV